MMGQDDDVLVLDTNSVSVNGGIIEILVEESVKNDNNLESEPEEKVIEAEVQKLTEMKLSLARETASASVVNETVNGNSPCSDHAHGNEKKSPFPKSTDKRLEPKFHISVQKHQRCPRSKPHYDEDDCWSLSSSTVTSVCTGKTTVPVAPMLTCVDRLQRRKEFYSKLEEKHKALEKEKVEYEARVEEEEQAALKLMRKNMSYKANPVPSFYREGPPAKVELKKIPVTRAKSPNLCRRKSCSDAVTKSSPSEKAVGSGGARRSLGGTAKGTKASPQLNSKTKAGNGSLNSNGST